MATAPGVNMLSKRLKMYLKRLRGINLPLVLYHKESNNSRIVSRLHYTLNLPMYVANRAT